LLSNYYRDRITLSEVSGYLGLKVKHIPKLDRIMASLPRLVDTVKGRSSADPFVIALAATTNPSMIVVTEEYEGKTRIPDVCTAEKIEYCRLADLIERENWKF
jgi:hypothetical protein